MRTMPLNYSESQRSLPERAKTISPAALQDLAAFFAIIVFLGGSAAFLIGAA